jgi:multiple sugar transport system substrate-binding protein
MKKIGICFIVLFLISGVILSGCSPKTATEPLTDVSEPAEAEQEPVTIKWWVPNWDEEVAKVLVSEFEAENPNIKVEMTITTWDTMEGQIRTALHGDNAPDVITDLESRTPAYAEQGLLANLDPYFEASGIDLEDFVSSAIPLNSYNGSMYGMPMRHDGPAMIYNKDMFEAAGLDPDAFPTTWEELDEVAKALTVDTDGDGVIDQYGLGWPLGNEGNAVVRFYQLTYNFGGSITNAEGTKCELNSDAGKEALEYVYNNLNVDEVTPKSALESDNTGLTNLFINKKIAIYSNGAYDLSVIREGAPDINIGTATYPGLGEGIGVTIVNGFNLYIPEKSNNKDAAWKLVEFVGRAENSGRLTTTFPARKSAFELERYNDPLLAPFIAQMDSGKAGPTYKNWSQMQAEIYNQIQQVLLNNKDITTALNDMCTAVDTLLVSD